MSINIDDLELLDAIRDFALSHTDPVVEKFKPGLRDWGDEWRQVAPVYLPAAEQLQTASANAIDQTRDLLSVFEKHKRRLHWEQSYKKEDAVVSDAMLAAYGFAEIIGNRGPFVSDRVRAGIGVYGPGIDYPRHRHHPEEIYIVLAGSASFELNHQAAVEYGPGKVIFNASNEAHGFRTGAEAIVIFYLWQAGNLREISRFD